MKVCSRNRTAPFLCTGVFLLAYCLPCLAQQSAPPSPSSASLAQSAPSADLAAQEDALIKLCNEQLNVKGQFKDAEETAQQALDLSRKLSDKKRIMVALMYLASAYAYQGRFVEALEVHQQSADLAREIGNRKGLSRALNNIAGTLAQLGRLDEALNYFYQSMQVARELDDLPMQYTLLTNIGRLYMASGDPDKAEAPLQESLRIGRGLKHSDLVSNPSKVATEGSLTLLGDMEAQREHYQLALNYYQEVRDSHPDNPQAVMDLLQNMAFVYQRLGVPQKSVEFLQQALPMAEKQHSASYPQLVGGLGEGQESLGQFQEALASENRALAMLRQSGGNPDYEWQVERQIGHIYRSMGNREEALAHYQDSMHGLEQLRSVALNTEFGRAGIGGRSRSVYAEAADLLYDVHREAHALATAERGRARAFLDMLALSRTGLADELSPEQRQREAAILTRISVAQKGLWKENLPPDQEKKDKADLAAAEDDLEAFQVEVRQSNPRYASIQYPEPMNLAQIQSGLLDEHTALAEFLLGEKRSLVWVVTRNGLTTAVLPPRSEIEDQVTAYRKLITQHASALTMNQSLDHVHRLGAKLYSSLIQPIEPAIAAHRTLIIVPDGALFYLPFEALVTGSPGGASASASPSYLVEKFAILYGPSASALVTVQAMNRKSSPPQNMLLAFGDPSLAPTPSAPAAAASSETSRSVSDSDHSSSPPASPAMPIASAASLADDYTERGFSFTPLPYTRDEVLAISKLFPASQRQVYLGADAREETVKSAKLEDFRYIHFASHGFIDEAKPGRSRATPSPPRTAFCKWAKSCA
jgi:CHAT domain-containing protein/Tfp pilus assembly protein PilF